MKHQTLNKAESDVVKPIKRGMLGHFFYWLGMSLTHRMIHLEAEGLENIPQEQPYILASNHETYVDGMIIASFLPKHQFKYFTSLAAQDLLTDHGLFGRIIMSVGQGIPLDRKGSPTRGLISAKHHVEAGNILLVHPEGTRTADGKLGVIHNGAAFIAKKTNVPLVPVFIDGAYEVFNRHMRWPKGKDPITKQKRSVIIRFGQPLLPQQFQKAKDMTEKLKLWLHEQFNQKQSRRIYT